MMLRGGHVLEEGRASYQEELSFSAGQQTRPHTLPDASVTSSDNVHQLQREVTLLIGQLFTESITPFGTSNEKYMTLMIGFLK